MLLSCSSIMNIMHSMRTLLELRTYSCTFVQCTTSYTVWSMHDNKIISISSTRVWILLYAYFNSYLLLRARRINRPRPHLLRAPTADGSDPLPPLHNNTRLDRIFCLRRSSTFSYSEQLTMVRMRKQYLRPSCAIIEFARIRADISY